MAGREKRKRRRHARERREAPRSREEASLASSRDEAPAGPPVEASRRESKDDVAREALEPLGQGERPRAVLVGAVISGLLGLTTLILFVAGVDTGDADFSAGGTLLYAGLMLLMAWGMWTVRYWAVLGFQALLALLVIVWSLLLIQAKNFLVAAVALAVVVGAGTLFWFLVKSLARIQMPRRGPQG